MRPAHARPRAARRECSRVAPSLPSALPRSQVCTRPAHTLRGTARVLPSRSLAPECAPSLSSLYPAGAYASGPAGHILGAEGVPGANSLEKGGADGW